MLRAKVLWLSLPIMRVPVLCDYGNGVHFDQIDPTSRHNTTLLLSKLFFGYDLYNEAGYYDRPS